MADSNVSILVPKIKKRTRRAVVPPFCEISVCGKKYFAKGFCVFHYNRYMSGLDPTARTRFDPNEIIVKGDIAEIVLYDKNNIERDRAIIDACDVGKVSKFKWCLSCVNQLKYVVCPKEKLLLHRLILDAPDDMEVDHKNGNTLDNRRTNIRFATHTQNMRNSRSSIGESRFKGVCPDRKTNQWLTQLNHKYIGVFTNEISAALAYDKAAKEHFGEFARLNFPELLNNSI